MDNLRFDERGLIPAVVQDRAGRVLMLAYMNRQSLERTLQSGETWFYSRSRQELWHKGETSGHRQKVLSIRSDCDGDALLITVEQQGVACHLGKYSCFEFDLQGVPLERDETGAPAPAHPIAVLGGVEAVLQERRRLRPQGSYTAGLFERAPDAICKKVGEEATEVVLASKNADLENLVHEVADLWFHCLALLVHHGVPLARVAGKLEDRRR